MTRAARGRRWADPRVAVEYGAEHEKAGSIRMYETLPFFSGRSTLEGVYNQASVHHAPRLLPGLGAGRDARRTRSASASTRSFDTDAALAHLRLFNVDEVVAVSPQLVGEPASRGAAVSRDRARAAVHRLPPRRRRARLRRAAGATRPCARRRAAGATRATAGSRASPFGGPHLVFTDDPALRPSSRRTSGSRRPRGPLPGGVEAHATMADEAITHHHQPRRPSAAGEGRRTTRAGRPRARTARTSSSPGLMIVVPRAAGGPPRLRAHARRTSSALVLTVLAVAGAALSAWRRRRRAPAPAVETVVPADACDVAPPPRRWGARGPGRRARRARRRPRRRAAGGGARPHAAVRRRLARVRRGSSRRRRRVRPPRRHARGRGLPAAPRSCSACAARACCARPAAAGARKRSRPWCRTGSAARSWRRRCSAPRARTHAAGNPAAAAAARERLLRDHRDTPWAGPRRRRLRARLAG